MGRFFSEKYVARQ